MKECMEKNKMDEHYYNVTFNEFVAYWNGKKFEGLSAGKKTNWHRTFYNWVRNAMKYHSDRFYEEFEI